MTELQIYGKDGLFHSIVKANKIMNGRYAVLPGGGMDLNMNNVLSGIDFPQAKYPGVFCLTPTSAFLNASVIGQWESYNFTLFFVTTANNTGDNKLKKPDAKTNSSLHTTPEDWSDMHQIMVGFMAKLEEVSRSRELRSGLRMDQKSQWIINRFSNKGNDNVNGVVVRFTLSIPALCEFTEQWNEVDLPDFETNNHPQHFH